MDRANKILFILLLLFLSTVMLVSIFHTKQIKTLKGTFVKIDRPKLSIANWLSRDFQMQMDKRTNYRFFLRSVLIKTRNQIDYALFDKVNATLVSKGKDDMLYSTKHITSYLGENFDDGEKIAHQVERLVFIQETLEAMGKKFLVVIGPSKAAYYPNNFPIKFDRREKQMSIYDYYANQLQEKHIHHIDFNKVFVDMKDTISYPIYTKQGTHWNNYAYQYAWNMIVDSLEQDTDWKLARLQANEIKLEPAKDRDLDLYELLNVFCINDTTKTAYQDYSIDTTNIDRPTGLVIADSYFWGLRGLGFSREVLNNGMFWYYNNTAYPAEREILYTPKDYDFQQVIEDTDIVIMLVTAANLDMFPFGFEDDFYEEMTKASNINAKKEKTIDRMIKKIEQNEEWYGDLQTEAKEKNQSLDSILRVAATYFLDQEEKSKKESK